MAGDNEEVRYLGDLSKLQVGPNDVMILQAAERLSMEQIERITARMEGVFGQRRVIVLDKGMTLGAVEMLPSIIHVDEAGVVTFPGRQ